MDLKTTISNNLRKYRAEAGLSRDEISALLKVKYKTYQAWEEARAHPPLRYMLTLCDIYKIEITDLVETGRKIKKVSTMARKERLWSNYQNLSPDKRKFIDYIMRYSEKT